MILFRPVGLEELRLVFEAEMRAFPPLPRGQSIFDPVLTEEHARQVASEWNASADSRAAFVTRFVLDDEYAARFERHLVGNPPREELWIPADELEMLNEHVVDEIEVVAAFFGDGWRELAEDPTGVAGMLDYLAACATQDLALQRILLDETIAVCRALAATDAAAREGLARALGDDADLASSEERPDREMESRAESILLLRTLLAERGADQQLEACLGEQLTERATRRSELGDSEGARRDAEDAAALLRVPAIEGGVPEFELVDALEVMAELAASREDWSTCLTVEYERAAVLRAGLDRPKPHSWFERDLAHALTEIGRAYFNSGDARSARPAYEEALALQRRRQSASPDDRVVASRIADLLYRLADCAECAEDAPSARRFYADARRAFAGACTDSAEDMEIARDFHWLLERAARFHEKAGELDEALALRIEQVEVGRRIADREATPECREELRADLLDVATLHLRRSDPRAAAEAYREAADVARGAAAADTQPPTWSVRLQFCLAHQRDALMAAGAEEDALEVARELVTLVRSAVASAPGDSETLRTLLTDVDALGDCLRDAGNAAAAAGAFDEAIAIGRDLVATDPSQTMWRDDLGIALGRRAGLALDGQDPRAALVNYEASVEQARALVAAAPGEAKWRRKLRMYLTELSEAHTATGDHDSALAALDEAVPLLRANPDPAHDGSAYVREVLIASAADAAAAAGRPDLAQRFRSHLAEIGEP